MCINAGYCEHGNEISGSVKDGGFLYSHWLSTFLNGLCSMGIVVVIKQQSLPIQAVIMMSPMFWAIMSCSPLKVDWCFGGVYRLHIQSRRISQQRNQHKAGRNVCWIFASLHFSLAICVLHVCPAYLITLTILEKQKKCEDSDDAIFSSSLLQQRFWV
jgi:hypothetical protein